jgi:glutaredoxin 2
VNVQKHILVNTEKTTAEVIGQKQGKVNTKEKNC